MARSIADFNGTKIPVSATYPFGDIADTPGANTTVDRASNSDLQQFFQKLMDYVSVVPSGLPDNDDNGYQLHDSLLLTIVNSIDGTFNTVGYAATSYSDDPTDPIKAGKIGQKMVYLQGRLHSIASNSVINVLTLVFKLPATNLYPSHPISATAFDDTGNTVVYLSIQTNGDVYIVGNATPFNSRSVYINTSYLTGM
jgi:hypothetical protein